MFVAGGISAERIDSETPVKCTSMSVPVNQYGKLTRMLPLDETNIRKCAYSLEESGHFMTETISVCSCSLVNSKLGVKISSGAWTITGDTLHAIAPYMPKNVNYDTYSCWRQVLQMLFSWLGAPRTCALIWKLHASTEVTVTQVGENVTFDILAAMFPGMCKRAVSGEFSVLRADVFHTLLATIACELHFLPDGLVQSVEAVNGPKLPIISLMISRGTYCVGHHRWVCLDSTDSDMETLKTAVLYLAHLRGIITAKAVVLDATKDDIAKFATLNIALETQPLAVAVVATAEQMPTLCRLVLPYASVCLIIGNSLRTFVSPYERPSMDWPRVAFRHTGEPVGSGRHRVDRFFFVVASTYAAVLQKRTEQVCHINPKDPVGSRAMYMLYTDIDETFDKATLDYLNMTSNLIIDPDVPNWKDCVNKLFPHIHTECIVRLAST